MLTVVSGYQITPKFIVQLSGNFNSMRKILLIILLTSALFAKAQSVKSTSNFSFSDSASSTGWINFDFYNNNRIYIPAKINGQPASVLLISLIQTSSMDYNLAASIGLQPKAGDTSRKTAVVDIEFGSLTLHNVNTSIRKPVQANKSTGRSIPFLLGDGLLDQLAVDIDFANHRIAFLDPANLKKPTDATEVPVILTMGHRTVPVSIEGAPAGQFELGLGNSAPFLVYQPYYEKYKLLENRPKSLRQGGGGAGPFPIEPVATMNTARFAGVDFSRLPSALIPDSLRKGEPGQLAGDIGIPILSRFRLIIDYSHDKLYVIPYTNAKSTPFVKDRLGLVLAKQDTVIEVKFVSPGSPAQAADFKTGDRITLIDKKPVQAWPDSEIPNLRYAPTGTTYIFTIDDGSTRQVSLADFF
jgi:PDZ domain